ncbi:M20 metallopeptidase family protein [Anaerobranca gottschalkii]|uniref:Amidohydrolase n=1 Tax=Anaerobranca gottschalkii DSM 13577 TaxID=1120990 RepID=A0A1H9ZJS3_9FIRM|nr:amidohydrolase [Anaerobranca gottschalkii]SES81364.1 amidohydrolase [Anaerobranca gottschalkii DSM 13577]
MDLIKEIKALEKEIISWRRWFHQHPGVGFDVEETAVKIEEILKEIGYSELRRYAKTGVIAYLEVDSDYPIVALRADIDGLPMEEENDLPYKSIYPGKNHACGHDAHIAMVLGAAKYLYNNKDKLKNNLLLIFQPGEEGYGGAKRMLDDGLYRDYPFQRIYGCHIGLIFPELKGGQIGLSYNPIMAATVEFKITIKGRGGHGAMPQKAVDPILIAGNIITSVQSIVSRNLAPTDTAVISFGKIQGGTAFNIIPEEVLLTGTIRYLEEAAGKEIFSRLELLVEGIAKSYGGYAKVEIISGYPPLVNNKEVTEFVNKKLIEIFSREDIINLKKPTMGGEDMAYFLNKAPGCFFFLGAGNEEKGIVYPHHHPKFNIDEGVLWEGTAAFCKLILETNL